MSDKYDFSEFAEVGSRYGEVGPDGRFTYEGLDSYWREDGRVPLTVEADGRLAGFVLVNRWSALNRLLDHSVAEFFVLRKYRRSASDRAPQVLFDRWPGRWEVAVVGYNKPALTFRRKATKMKTRWMLSGAIILLMSGSFTEAQATLVGQGDPFRINFDENGHGSYQVCNPATGMYGPVVNDPGVIVADSTTPTGTALQYTLPQTVTGGDVGILEPSSTTCTAATCSDALRFITVAGTSVMRYYSDREANEALDLADSSLPSNFNAGAFVSEIGPEGNNGFMFVAGSGNPLITNFYIGISDVPEPATIALLGTGIIGLFGFGALRRRRG